MTSARRRRANRANAQASTGPKSAAGKQRVAKNALRHGLNVSIYSDASIAPEVEAMARKIAGDSAGAEIVALARHEHPYEVPGISTRTITDGNPDYLAWIAQETAPEY